MRQTQNWIPRIHGLVVGTLLAISLLTIGSSPALCQKAQTIEGATKCGDMVWFADFPATLIPGYMSARELNSDNNKKYVCSESNPVAVGRADPKRLQPQLASHVPISIYTYGRFYLQDVS